MKLSPSHWERNHPAFEWLPEPSSDSLCTERIGARGAKLTDLKTHVFAQSLAHRSYNANKAVAMEELKVLLNKKRVQNVK